MSNGRRGVVKPWNSVYDASSGDRRDGPRGIGAGGRPSREYVMGLTCSHACRRPPEPTKRGKQMSHHVKRNHHCGCYIPPAVGMGGRTYICSSDDSQCSDCEVLDLKDEVERLRARVEESNNVKWRCSGCGNEIDPEWCCCGNSKNSHLGWEEHQFVPMGCDCLRTPVPSGGDGREALAHWMLENSFATGHGDTLQDLLAELGWQIKELRARVAELEAKCG